MTVTIEQRAKKRLGVFGLLMLFLIMQASAMDVNAQTKDTEPVYIDVRTWVEHKFNHIDGDRRIHISGIVEGVEEYYPAKDTPIRLYCAKGVRSAKGVDRLKAAGYTDVENIGGIEDVKQLRFGLNDSRINK